MANTLLNSLGPSDPWTLREEFVDPAVLPIVESIFSLTNGRVGVRATLDEASPAYVIGTYRNGLHETWKIVHAEDAYGLAHEGQAIVTVPDGTYLRITVDEEPMLVNEIELLAHERGLHFRTGVLERSVEWLTRAGIHVDVKFERVVSYAHPDLVVTQVRLTTDQPAQVTIDSQIVSTQATSRSDDESPDPRRGHHLGKATLAAGVPICDELRVTQRWTTANSQQTVICRIDHQAEPTPDSHFFDPAPEAPGIQFSWTTMPGEAVVLTKYFESTTGVTEPSALENAMPSGFSELVSHQSSILDDFWRRFDVKIGGSPVTQLAIRWVLFQLFNHSTDLERSLPAKGLTGGAYDGHYFWDTEIYVLPFLVYTNPDRARTVLEHRYNMLDAARRRALQLNHRGALFPWRTINGEEASAFFPAGTAQYHIDAAIVYAIRKYIAATGDSDFLLKMGAEITFETARFWEDLGSYHNNEFHIDGVTGPDEYTALVNNNAYTNLMARMNLNYAVETAEQLKSEAPDQWNSLAKRLDIDQAEIASWRRAAELMRVPFDETKQITPQDDSFLDLEPWDFAGVSSEKYPLLLHFHPLNIYRHQVLKQADVVLADFLLGDQVSKELKRANFDFYDPLTTGDSSLSAPIQSIIASEVGRPDLALRYFDNALYTDLGNRSGNAHQGIHMAATGGVWLTLIQGFAGMRDHSGLLTFDPRVPDSWGSMSFGLMFQGAQLQVDIKERSIKFMADHVLEVVVRGRTVALAADTEVWVELD